ncbi:MAG: hypothetical protein SVG88_12870 [Halobacteriales archaeon]|nr:hypothetical protein [Halobacteriales archaeon]
MDTRVIERTDLTFRQATTVTTIGMILPAVPMALAGNQITTILNYHTFLGVLGLAFGLGLALLIERQAWDRLTVLFVVIVWPWVVFFTGLFTVLVLNEGEQIPGGPVADIYWQLVGSQYIWGGASPPPMIYGATFMCAGIGTVLLSVLVHRCSSGLFDTIR